MRFSDLNKKKTTFVPESSPKADVLHKEAPKHKAPAKAEPPQPVAEEKTAPFAPEKTSPSQESVPHREAPVRKAPEPSAQAASEEKFQEFMAETPAGESGEAAREPQAEADKPRSGHKNSAPHCLKPDLPEPKKTRGNSLWSKIPGLGGAPAPQAQPTFEMPKIVVPDSIPPLEDGAAYAEYLQQQEEQSYNLYEYSVLSVRYALLSLICEDRTAYAPVAAAAENITAMLDSGNQSLVALAGRRYMPDNTSRHSVNVAIYSVFLCEQLNMKKDERIFVACAALLHDLGTQKYERIINKPDKFTQAEREMIQRHPVDAKNIIENLEGLSKNTAAALAKVVMEVYEKYDGSGYPFKKQGESIGQHAQIISIANVYEALTHARSWRKELNQHDALKMMLDYAGTSFSRKIVRLLIDSLSMYPPGSLVRLSTGDLARVIEVNPKLISQPKVELLKNSRISAHRFLNLATEKGILITSVAPDNDKAGL